MRAWIVKLRCYDYYYLRSELWSRLVDGVAGDDGAEDAGFRELGGRNLGEVIRKDDKIGVLAHFQLALFPFLELSVGGT